MSPGNPSQVEDAVPVVPARKYRAFAPIPLRDRTWPDCTILRPPVWCSVDLRDGNQALALPMGHERKRRLFEQLVAMGFKEIEVGFPSASLTEFGFVRDLIEHDRIPADVTIQVLTPARPELVERTMESIRGARRVIVHVYNSTSEQQRRIVFRMDRDEVVALAVAAVRRVREIAADMPETEFVLEYSPESFTATELDFAVEICDAVMAQWHEGWPDEAAHRARVSGEKVIVNLPATVEVATPNVYADQIEWFCRHLAHRDRAVVSVHPHNDRGTAVAAAELAVMAGAERVEGTLFGNGERTGNVDIVTLALNLFSQGVDPGLCLRDIDELVRVAEHCTRLPVHPRHPYAGELVYTAFSGSHQDAIKKGFAAQVEGERWDVPYLPIDPADVGRSYESVVRINSQSGKGGVAYVMEHDYGFRLPRGLQIEFSRCVQHATDESGDELTSKGVRALFDREYLSEDGPFEFLEGRFGREADEISAVVRHEGVHRVVRGSGAGPIDAFVNGLAAGCGIGLSVRDYHEHALGSGADASAVAFVEVVAADGEPVWGVGVDRSIVVASMRAIVSAANRVARAAGARAA